MMAPPFNSSRQIWRFATLLISCTLITLMVTEARFDLKSAVRNCFSPGSEVKLATIEEDIENQKTGEQYKKLYEQLKTITDKSYNPRHTLYLSPNYPLAQLTSMAGSLKLHNDPVKLRELFGAEFMENCKNIADSYEKRLLKIGKECPESTVTKLRIKIGDHLAEVYRFCKYMSQFTYSKSLESILEADRDLLGDVRWNAMRMIERFSEQIFGPIKEMEEESKKELPIKSAEILEKPQICSATHDFVEREQELELQVISSHKDFVKLTVAPPAERIRHFAGGLRSSCLELSNQMHDILWLMKRQYLVDSEKPINLSPKARRLLATLDACAGVAQCNWNELGIVDHPTASSRGKPSKKRMSGMKQVAPSKQLATKDESQSEFDDDEDEDEMDDRVIWQTISQDVAELCEGKCWKMDL